MNRPLDVGAGELVMPGLGTPMLMAPPVMGMNSTTRRNVTTRYDATRYVAARNGNDATRIRNWRFPTNVSYD
jgi:hypothetical protein